MAAPSNKPSPSGQPVASSADSANANIKPESEALATIATAPSTTTETSAAATVATITSATAASHSPQQQQQQEEEEPSYQSSQASTDYAAAKALLNQGAFEDALSQIEQGIANTRHRLLSSSSFPKTEDEITFHPALAPFHYLYGTTLLYSVEESSDTMGLTNTTTNTAAAGSSAGNDGDAAAAANHQGEQGGADDDNDDDDNVEDIQIAWENLDLARTILERMMASSSNNNNKNATPTGSSDNEYALDLAQVYLRQGDLHKMNGRYESAVADYQACLKYRTQKLSTCPFDRRIADAHYNLALSHMLLVAEQRQQQQRPDADDTNNTAPTTTTTTTTTPSLSPAALKEHRERSIHHYLECARTFGGLLAILCHQDPNEFFQKLETDNGDVGTANLKTTGEEEEGQDTTSSNNNNNLDGDASRQVVKLRQHVQQHLQPPTADDDLQTKAEFEEICQLLTEIQETIDEAENSVKGVHQVAEMKAEISAAAAASVDDGNNNNNNNKEGQQQDAFGSSAAAASTAVAQTILAVKKKPKNKRPSAIVGAQDEATKRPKSAE